MPMRKLFFAVFRLWTDRGGNVSMIFGLSLVPIMGLVGISIDLNSKLAVRAKAQSALDAAVLAAVSKQAGARDTAAQSIFLADFSPPSGVTTPTLVWKTNADGSYTGTASGTVPTTIASAFGDTMSYSVTATANSKTTASPAGKVCILVLDKSSAQTLLVNSGVNLNAPNCEIDVASTNTTAGMFNSNLPNVASVCIAGGSTVNGGSKINKLTNHCTVASDPYANTIPKPTINASCDVSNQNYQGSPTINPGTYCGNFNFNGSGTLTLSPGTYVFKSTHWNINSGWTVNGTGVTLYFADGLSYVQFNSNVKVNLSAPSSGTYANVLIFEPNGLSGSQSFAVDGSSSGHNLQGLIYLPSRNITFNSTSNVSSDSLMLVVNQIILDTVNWTIAPTSNAVASASSSSGSGSTSVLLSQ